MIIKNIAINISKLCILMLLFAAAPSYAIVQHDPQPSLRHPDGHNFDHPNVATFHYPHYLGYRLDFCRRYGQNCGAPAADAFCRSQGYTGATRYKIARDVGPTRILGTDRICQAHSCDGFRWIRCEGFGVHHNGALQPASPHMKKFHHPRYKGAQLCYCYRYGQGCGRLAADVFCQKRGFHHAHNFARQPHAAFTRMIGNNKLCRNKDCEAFRWIRCSG